MTWTNQFKVAFIPPPKPAFTYTKQIFYDIDVESMRWSKDTWNDHSKFQRMTKNGGNNHIPEHGQQTKYWFCRSADDWRIYVHLFSNWKRSYSWPHLNDRAFFSDVQHQFEIKLWLRQNVFPYNWHKTNNPLAGFGHFCNCQLSWITQHDLSVKNVIRRSVRECNWRRYPKL